ncbi:MAG: Na+/H+ antiporter NhaC family protein [Victivallis sp.]
MDITDFSHTRAPHARALIPFGVFLVFYLGLSIWSNDFYKVPMPVAFLVASATALLLNRRASLKSKIELFAHGMGDADIMTMCLIFILAGAFASTARAMGAVDSSVQLALAVIPPNLLLAGLFVVACFISLAVGTSVGTIAALGSIGAGLSETLAVPPGFCLGAIVGGAMFGDNLSMISDTTIAATRPRASKCTGNSRRT